MRPNLYQLALTRKASLIAQGCVYKDGTVSFCPWPGCKRDAIAGWSSCIDHFDDMHPAGGRPSSRVADVASRISQFTKNDLLVFVEWLIQESLDPKSRIALGLDARGYQIRQKL